MTNLLLVEVRRALSRRLVRVLVLLAVVACGVLSVALLATVEPVEQAPAPLPLTTCVPPPGSTVCAVPLPPDAAETVPTGPAALVNLWNPARDEGNLFVAATFLLMGALVAGASMVGAEWKAGTIDTLLTWEPRRERVLAAKLAANGLLAAAISVALQGVFIAAFLPLVLVRGTTRGADASWALDLSGGVARIALATGLAAVLGGALANVGRNTGFAIGVAFAWISVGEGVIRGLRPRLQTWLVAETIGRFVTARPLSGVSGGHSTVEAGLLLALYIGSVVGVATFVFLRRDLSGAA